MKHSVSRRNFLQATLGAAAMAAMAGKSNGNTPRPQLARRTLGKTGVEVPILGYGCAQAGTERTIDEGSKLFQQAFEKGIIYFDTAPEWSGYGKSQVQLGHAFKGMREKVFLTTKAAKSKADEALRVLEQSLKELQTDYVDLLYVHSLGADSMDFETVTGPGGSMEFLDRARKAGMAKYIGVTGHNRPGRFVRVLQNYDLDVIMTSVNFVDRHTYNFEEEVWPVAAQKNVGLVAMKVFGGSLASKTADAKLPLEHHEQAFRYALSLPKVACAVVGMKTVEELNRNLAWAHAFKLMKEDEIVALRPLGKQIAAEWKDHLGKVA